MRPLWIQLVCLWALLLWTSQGLAATCTLNGSLKYEPIDLYYCDSNRLSTCSSGWYEKDLDLKRGTTAVPLPYMKTEIRLSQSGAPVATVHTDANGAFSTTVTVSSATCAGATVWVVPMFWRRHETDTSKYRFRLADASGSDKGAPLSVALSGATTSWPYIFPASDKTSLPAHQFAVYFSANSAVTQMVTWNTTVNTRFTGTTVSDILKITVDPAFDTTSKTIRTTRTIDLRYSAFRSGATVRHELGHWVHMLAHNRVQTTGCSNYDFPNTGTGDNHGLNTCEWGFAGTIEGTASFFAARSITSNDMSAWYCRIDTPSDPAQQDDCSKEISTKATTDPDSDGVVPGKWAIYDDTGASSTAHCVIGGTGCQCGGLGQPACNNATFRANNGHRIETNIARFLWDIVDSNNEASQDDSDMSVGSIVTMMVGMSCGTTGGVDGDCNEPNLATCTTASRDKYNVYDFSELLVNPTSESTERTLNCVALAPD